MKIINVEKNKITDEVLFHIPREFYGILGSSDVNIYAAEMFEELQGVLVWQAQDEEGKLLSIDIDPGARELGIGRRLVWQMLEDAGEKGISEISYGYAEDDEDKEALTDFLESMGGVADYFSYPLGIVCAGEAVQKLKEQKLSKAGTRVNCRDFQELDRHEKALMLDFIKQNTDLPADIYIHGAPCLCVVEDGQVKSAMLFRETGERLLLEYCYLGSGDPYTLAAMLDATMAMLEECPLGKEIYMILATEQSQKLFSKLFGEAQEEILVTKGAIPCIKEMQI